MLTPLFRVFRGSWERLQLRLQPRGSDRRSRKGDLSVATFQPCQRSRRKRARRKKKRRRDLRMSEIIFPSRIIVPRRTWQNRPATGGQRSEHNRRNFQGSSFLKRWPASRGIAIYVVRYKRKSDERIKHNSEMYNFIRLNHDNTSQLNWQRAWEGLKT